MSSCQSVWDCLTVYPDRSYAVPVLPLSYLYHLYALLSSWLMDMHARNAHTVRHVGFGSKRVLPRTHSRNDTAFLQHRVALVILGHRVVDYGKLHGLCVASGFQKEYLISLYIYISLLHATAFPQCWSNKPSIRLSAPGPESRARGKYHNSCPKTWRHIHVRAHVLTRITVT